MWAGKGVGGGGWGWAGCSPASVGSFSLVPGWFVPGHEPWVMPQYTFVPERFVMPPQGGPWNCVESVGSRNNPVWGGARPFSNRGNGVELSAPATAYGGAATVDSATAAPTEKGVREGPGPSQRTLGTKPAGGGRSPPRATSSLDRAAVQDTFAVDLAEDIVKADAGRALGQADDGGVVADGTIRGPDGLVLKPSAISDLDMPDYKRGRSPRFHVG